MGNKFILEPVVVGMFHNFKLEKFLYNFRSEETIDAPCISWIARSTSSDRTILVDTGPSLPTPETHKFHSDIEIQPHNRIDRALTNQGIDPLQITDVIFTHLHFDHCANAEYLPNARILVQRTELQYAVAPHPQHKTGYEAGYKNVFPAWMKYFDRIETVDGDSEIAPGARVLLVPGHTPGSSAVVFDTNDGTHCIAGDLVNQLENWNDGTGNHIAPAKNIGIGACIKAFQKIEKAADIVLASHDFRMLDKSKYG